MGKTFKKILCSLLVVVMCLTSAPLQGFVGMEWPSLPEISFGDIELPKVDFSEWFSSEAQAAKTQTHGDFKYVVKSNDTITITGYTGKNTELVIPSKIKDMKVTRIDDKAFKDNKVIETISLPDTIKIIGEKTFSNCEKLSNIVFPNSLEELGSYAFENCISLTKINIPKNLTTCKEYGPFRYCSNLREVEFEEGITKIVDNLFQRCTGLESIVIPDTVTKIGYDAFYTCTNLRNITFSNKLTSIGEEAFIDCVNLENIVLPETLKRIDSYAFMGCESLTEINIPKNLSICGEYGPFRYCSNIEKVKFEKGITKIPDNLFQRCNGLVNITIPDTVKEIGYDAFYACENLSRLSTPSTLTTIGEEAFKDCINLNLINLSDSITTIKTKAFDGCSNLFNVYYEGTKEQWKKVSVKSGNKNLTENIRYSSDVEPQYYIEPIDPLVLNKFKTGDKFMVAAYKYDNGTRERLYNVSWKSNNRTVATVTTAGQVEIKNKGLAFITFTFNDKTSMSFPIIANDYIREEIGLVPKREDIVTIDYKGQEILDKTGFDITDILSNISLDGGKLKGPTITIAGKEVTLFEFDVGTDFPLLDATTIVVDTKEKRIKVGIGIKENSSAQVGKAGQKTTYWSESYKEVKNLYQKATGKKVSTTKLWNDFSALRGRLKKINGKMALNCDTYFAGYLEFSYSKNSFEFVEGGVLAECNFGASVESKWPSFPAAYTVFGVRAGAHGDLTVEVKDYKSSYTGNIGGNLTASYGVGLGEKKASTYIEGGMEATLNVNFAFPASSLKNSLTVGMTGDFYVTAKALGYELYSDVFPFADFQLYPSFQQNRRMMMLRNVSATELEKTATPIDRDYTTDESKIDIAEDTFKKSDLYAFNAPTLVQLSNNKQMLVWVDDDGTKSSINRTTLYYSIFNGSAWSMPDIVFESKGYNGTPVVVSDGTNVHILWSMSPEMSAADGYTELVKSLDLFYIKYNGSIFEEPIQITTANDIQEFSYDMTLVGSDVYITWLENSDNNSMMSTGKNSLKAANIVNGALSDVNTIIETSDFITGTTMLAEDTLSYYIITESDSGSKLLEFKEGIETELRNIPERMSQLDTFNNLITFVEDSRLIKYNGETFYAFNMDNVDNYEFVTNGTETAVITLVQGANGSVKMMVSYHNEEDNTWTSFVPLLDDGTYIRNYSSIMNSDGEILAAVNSVELNENQNADGRYGEATLYVLNGSNYFDLSIGDYLYFDDAENDSEDALIFEVTNNSSSDISSLTVNIQDTDGVNEIINVPCELSIGETEKFSVWYQGLDTLSKKDVVVTVSNSQYVENNLDNNSVSTTIGYADIDTKNIFAMYDECKAEIKLDVVNVGYADAKDIIVSLINDDEFIGSLEIDNLEPSESENIVLTIPNRLLANSDEEYTTLCICIETDSEEDELANNTVNIVYNNFDELTEEGNVASEHSIEFIEKIEPSCLVAGKELFRCLKCDYENITIIQPTNHKNSQEDSGVAPTCNQNGYTAGLFCEDCKMWIEGHTVISATGHNFDGSKCTNCDYDRADSCDCKCHKSGIAKIIFKIILIFQKIFKKNKECTCGVYHY